MIKVDSKLLKNYCTPISRENEYLTVTGDMLFDDSLPKPQKQRFLSKLIYLETVIYNPFLVGKTPKDVEPIFSDFLDSILTSKHCDTLTSNAYFLWSICTLRKHVGSLLSQQLFSSKFERIGHKYFVTHSFVENEQHIADDINNTILGNYVFSKIENLSHSTLDDEHKNIILSSLIANCNSKHPSIYWAIQIQSRLAYEFSSLDITRTESMLDGILNHIKNHGVEYMDDSTFNIMNKSLAMVYIDKVKKINIGQDSAEEKLAKLSHYSNILFNLRTELAEKGELILPTNLKDKKDMYHNAIICAHIGNWISVTVDDLVSSPDNPIKTFFEKDNPMLKNKINLAPNTYKSLLMIPEHIKARAYSEPAIPLDQLDYTEEMDTLKFIIETKLRAIYTMYAMEFIPSLINNYDEKTCPYTKDFLLKYHEQLTRGTFKKDEKGNLTDETNITMGGFFNKITGQDQNIKLKEAQQNIDLFCDFVNKKTTFNTIDVAGFLGRVAIFQKYRNASSHSDIMAVKYNICLPRISKKDFEYVSNIGLFAPNSILKFISIVFDERINEWQKRNIERDNPLAKTQQEQTINDNMDNNTAPTITQKRK